jgi:hypothetical protein
VAGPITKASIAHKGQCLRNTNFKQPIVYSCFKRTGNRKENTDRPGKGLDTLQKVSIGTAPTNIFHLFKGVFGSVLLGHLEGRHECPLDLVVAPLVATSQSYQQSRRLPPVTKGIHSMDIWITMSFASISGA